LGFYMIGTIVNAIAIIIGSLLGLLFRSGIPDRFKTTIMQGLSLVVILIGIKTALVADALLVVIVSLAIGSVIGELLRIEDHLEDLGRRLEKRFSNRQDSVARGFVTASLMFCVGSMAIVGSLESGLTGNHQTLFAKSTLDGIASIIFASTMGIGVLFSAIPVLLYQGFITLTATFIKPLLIPSVIAEMSATGGLLITAIGLNLLGLMRIRIGNMLPAIFLPLLYYFIKTLLKAVWSG
jgi:uncharacterized protein